MPIVDLDPRFRELGRLRLGEDLGDRPTALDHWRLTSPHEDLLAAASELYGGTVDVWRDGYELTTTTNELEVLVPFQDVAAGQWLELWQGSTLARRCNGRQLVELDHHGNAVPVGPCQCSEPRQCKPVTHLRVVLPQIPDLGVWRLVTRSVYAAIELPGAVELLLRTHGGELAPAALAIEHRRGSGRRPFLVPVLRSRHTLNQLTLLEEAATPSGSLEAGASRLAPTEAPSSPPAGLPTASDYLAEAKPAGEAQNGLEAPRSPVDGPEALPGPPAHEWPKMDVWRRLAALLRANPPSELPQNPQNLRELLLELEELMVDVGLWSPTTAGVAPLDSSAAKYGLDDWRRGGAPLDELRAFAQRSLMAAGNRLMDHRFGLEAMRLEEEEATP